MSHLDWVGVGDEGLPVLECFVGADQCVCPAVRTGRFDGGIRFQKASRVGGGIGQTHWSAPTNRALFPMFARRVGARRRVRRAPGTVLFRYRAATGMPGCSNWVW